MRPRAPLVLAALAAALAALVLLRLVAGPGGAWSWPEGDAADLRLHRIAIALVVGAALGVAGVLSQTLLRNPLASPDLIGATAGASLAVTVAAALGTLAAGAGVATAPTQQALFAAASPAAALAGALGALALVYALAQRRGLVDPASLVLVGVMASIVAGALTALVASLAADRGLSISAWLGGSISADTPASTITLAAAALALTLGPALAAAPRLDVAMLADDEARSLGVNVHRLRLWLFLGAGALTAAAVVLAGPIAFVGLVCPHAVRLLVGPHHRPLLVGSAIAGAGLLIAADLIARVIDLGTGRLPLGVITALIGGPVFVALLRRGPSRLDP